MSKTTVLSRVPAWLIVAPFVALFVFVLTQRGDFNPPTRTSTADTGWTDESSTPEAVLSWARVNVTSAAPSCTDRSPVSDVSDLPALVLDAGLCASALRSIPDGPDEYLNALIDSWAAAADAVSDQAGRTTLTTADYLVDALKVETAAIGELREYVAVLKAQAGE